ncbi:hypothetical protein [Aeromicrobium sp.]|uniref:hypothetical protein n=1 Tax=Aeromicrobium sp. TaxID=1871063 RepID=UPI003D6AA9B0
MTGSESRVAIYIDFDNVVISRASQVKDTGASATVAIDDNRALIIVCNKLRIRSGLASAKASPSRPAGSTMRGAVIVMTPFEDSVEG